MAGKTTKMTFRADEFLTHTIDNFVKEEGIKNRSEFLRMVVTFFFMAKMTGFLGKGDIRKVVKKFNKVVSEHEKSL